MQSTKRFKFSKSTKKAYRVAKKRTSRAANATVTVPRWASRYATGFPTQLRIKHRYCDIVPLTSALGVYNTYIFKCNGMFDPDVTSTGHQPMYFDQLSALYNHFTVVKSRITVQFVNNNTAPATANVQSFGIYIDDDGSAGATGTVQAMEQNSAVSRIFTLSSDPITLSKSWDAVKAFGRNPETDPNLQGTSAGDPTEIQTFVIFTQGIVASNTTSQIMVSIEYDAIWQELKQVASS